MTTIGVVQAGSLLGDTPRTLDKLRQLSASCASQGVQVAVFPEAFIGGYPKGLVFGASVGIRTEAGRDLFQAYAESAIAVPGPVASAIGAIAKQAALYLVVGAIERDGGTLYCSTLYFAPDGSLIGKHRKLTPTAAERVIWGAGDGSTLKVVETPLGKMGGLICWENYMPLARMAMYSQGVELYCVPTVDDRDVWIPTVRHIAREGRCFVLSSCQFLTRSGYPDPWLESAQDLAEIPINGGSCIVGPLGEFLAGPVYGAEAILSAEVELSALTRAKFDFDVIGHYARPDVFEFFVK
jgi:nitrilase